MSFDSNSIPAKLIQLALGATPVQDFFAPYTYSEVEPLARHHRLLSLTAQCFPENPQAIADQRQIALRDLQIKALTSSLKSQLTQAGIPHWEFKGAALGDRLGEKVSRESRDIDILIPPQYFHDAYSIVVQGRTVQGPGYPEIGPANDKWRAVKDVRILNNQPNIKIELHWRITAKYLHLDINELVWEEISQSGDITDSLLSWILCVHAAEHGFYRIRWARDLAILEKQGKNPFSVSKQLPKTNAVSLVEQAMQKFKDPSISLSNAQPSKWVEKVLSGSTSPPTWIEDHKMRFEMCPTLSSKLHLLVCLANGKLFPITKI
jgi:hypothetical protein